MTETEKSTAEVQDEVEKEIPETDPVTEPVEESPEATAGNSEEETESAETEENKESKGKTSFFGKKKKDNKLEQQVEDLTDRLKKKHG